MICRQKLYHFMVANLVLTATRQRSGKTGICDRKMIQFMPANHSNTSCYHMTITMMNILMKLSYNETFVFIFLLPWHFYPTTNVFLSMLYFYIWTNVNTKALMQFQYDTDTSTTVNNHGLLEMKGETRWLGMPVFIWGYRNMLWIPATQKTSYEIAARNNWHWQHVIFKYSPRLRGSLSSYTKMFMSQP